MDYKIIYDKLKERDRALTEEKFSTAYLGMSKHYVSMCKSREVDISNGAVLQLWAYLNKLGTLWEEIASTGTLPGYGRATSNARFFKELADLTLDQVKQASSSPRSTIIRGQGNAPNPR